MDLYGNKGTIRNYLIVDLFQAYTDAHPSENLKHKLVSVRDLGPLAGHHCHEYTPLVFRRHRLRIVSNGKRCARHVNDLMRLVQRIFRWGVSMEMVSLETYNQLKTVDPLKANEVNHQSKKRQPAKREDVERTLEELAPMPAAIVRLILFTGARPGEICKMKASEVTKDGPHGVWVYRPGSHKTAHHGKRRFVTFGNISRQLLQKHWPSHADYFFPSTHIVSHYQPASLRQAVSHACTRAGVPHFSPYQLRHLRLTELATDKGLEAAAAVAGHGEQSTTKLYQHEPDVIALREAV
jgi:integrase